MKWSFIFLLTITKGSHVDKKHSTIINLSPPTGSGQTVQLHRAWWRRTTEDTPKDEPPTGGCGHGRHTCDELAQAARPNDKKPRRRTGRSQTYMRCRIGHAYHSCLAQLREGRGNIPPTHASRRHAKKVDTTMLVPTPRIQENICGICQPRTAPGNACKMKPWRLKCTHRWGEVHGISSSFA